MDVYLGKYNRASRTCTAIEYDDASLGDRERRIWQGLYSGWLRNSLDLIELSYGSNFSFGSNSTLGENRLYVTFYSDSSDSALAGVDTPTMNDAGQSMGPLRLKINMAHYTEFKTGDESDGYATSDDVQVGNSYYLERIISHELTHAVMDANINNATGQNGLPQFIKEGMAELTHGCDDKREDEISTYAKNPTTLKDSLDITKPHDNYPAYSGGYMFLRYIAKQFSTKGESDSYNVAIRSEADSYIDPPPGIVPGSNLLTATSKFTGNSIVLTDYGASLNTADATEVTQKVALVGSTMNDSLNSGTGADKLYGGDGADTLLGNDGNDTLFGDAGHDILYGGNGNDILYGGDGNDTLYGGTGADVFVFEDGKDVITDYEEGVDKIKLASRFLTSSSVSGSDLLLFTDDGSIMVKNGEGKQITIIDYEGEESTEVYGRAAISDDNWSEISGLTLNRAKTELKIETPFMGTIDAANFSKLKKMNASNDSNTVKLIGNAKNNKLMAGSGGSTLDGAGGNDKLYGGNGVDVFIYDGQGKDRLVFTEEITKAKASGKNVKFTFEGGTLTVDKAVGMTMAITTSDGQTNSYVFDKKTKSMDAARNNVSAQLPSYWFDEDTQADPLESILPIENISVDFEDQFELKNMLKTNELTYSARIRHQK